MGPAAANAADELGLCLGDFCFHWKPLKRQKEAVTKNRLGIPKEVTKYHDEEIFSWINLYLRMEGMRKSLTCYNHIDF